MKKAVSYLVAVLVFSVASVSSSLGADDPCAQYYNKGYCVDYIQRNMSDLNLGIRPSGNAGIWHSNVCPNDVQANDVAIFDSGTYGHVAWVDEVSPDGNNVTLSEWNFSDQYTKLTSNRSCGVTDEFNTPHEPRRTISKTRVSRFWRPSLGISSSNINCDPVYRIVDNVAWSPPNKSCLSASMWIFYSQGYPNGAQCVSSDICHQEESAMKTALGSVFPNWWLVLYSSVDLVENGTCTQ